MAKHQGEQEQGKEQAKAEAGRLKASVGCRALLSQTCLYHYKEPPMGRLQ